MRTISTATKSRCIIQLKSGQFILRNNDGTILKAGEIFIIDEEDKAKMINTSGHIFSLCALDQAEFAIGKNQSIQIIDAPQNAIKSILKGFDEIYTCLASRERFLISGSNNGNIRVWNLKNNKCIQCVSNATDNEYSTLTVHPSLILAGNSEQRRIRLWSFKSLQQPLAPLHLFEGDLINIQKLVDLGSTHVGILCYAYYFENDFKIFL